MVLRPAGDASELARTMQAALVPRSVLALGRERPEIPCFGCVISNTVAIYGV